MALIKLKAYDVRVACEFAITDIEEQIKQQRTELEERFRRVMLPSFKKRPLHGWRSWPVIGFFLQQELDKEDADFVVSKWMDNNFDAGELQCKLDRLVELKDMASYAGDVYGELHINAGDFKLLRHNLRG